MFPHLSLVVLHLPSGEEPKREPQQSPAHDHRSNARRPARASLWQIHFRCANKRLAESGVSLPSVNSQRFYGQSIKRCSCCSFPQKGN